MKIKDRIYEFDGFRGIIAFLIVVFHLTFGFDYSYPAYQHASKLFLVVEFGRNYVYLFLMLSGFFIMHSIEKKEDGFWFAVSRFSRLYPVYWAAVIITFVVVMIFGLPERQVNLLAGLVNLTMLQGFLRFPQVIGGAWILDRLLMFYFIFFLIMLLKKAKYVKTILLCWISMNLFLQFYVLNYGLNSFFLKELFRYLFVFLIANYMHHFAIGIVLYYFHRQKKLEIVDVILLGLCYILSYLMDGMTQLIFAALFTITAILITMNKLKFLSNKTLIFLGAISYALYLVHANIGFVIIREFYALNIDPNISVPVAILVSIGLAYILTKYIETPASKLIKSIYLNVNKKIRKYIKKTFNL